jgi:hypothetical protein
MESGVKCERCATRKALWTAVEDPEQDAAMLFGDDVVAMCLCGKCLEASEQDGPWSAVYRIDPRRPAA